MNTAQAMLIQYAPKFYAALPVHTSIALLDEFTLIEVPAAAYFCRHLVQWQQQFLPVMDLQALLHGAPLHHAPCAKYVMVLAYQKARFAALEYGALLLVDLPKTQSVTDEMATELPSNSDYWSSIARACFRHQEMPIPILDTASLFAGRHLAA